MRRYVGYVESSPAMDPNDPPRYPGRREGQNWRDRKSNGIPISPEAMGRFEKIARSLGLPPPGT